MNLEDPKLWNKFFNWYKTPAIKFKLLPYLKNKEFGLMVPKNFPNPERSVRMLNVPNVQSLDFFFSATGMEKQKTYYNFFSSVAKYHSGVPKVAYKKELRDPIKEKWNENHWEEIIEYDCFLDIDGNHSNFEITKQCTLEIFDYFMELNVPFYLRFSGKGFHFVIPYKYFINYKKNLHLNFNPNDSKNIYKFFGRIAKYLFDEFTELIDSQIYDSRRLIKLPFSLALYKHGFFVCLPINSRTDLIALDYYNTTNLNVIDLTTFDIRYYPDMLFNPLGNVDKLIDEITEKKYFEDN